MSLAHLVEGKVSAAVGHDDGSRDARHCRLLPGGQLLRICGGIVLCQLLIGQIDPALGVGKVADILVSRQLYRIPHVCHEFIFIIIFYICRIQILMANINHCIAFIFKRPRAYSEVALPLDGDAGERLDFSICPAPAVNIIADRPVNGLPIFIVIFFTVKTGCCIRILFGIDNHRIAGVAVVHPAPLRHTIDVFHLEVAGVIECLHAAHDEVIRRSVLVFILASIMGKGHEYGGIGAVGTDRHPILQVLSHQAVDGLVDGRQRRLNTGILNALLHRHAVFGPFVQISVFVYLRISIRVVFQIACGCTVNAKSGILTHGTAHIKHDHQINRCRRVLVHLL